MMNPLESLPRNQELVRVAPPFDNMLRSIGCVWDSNRYGWVVPEQQRELVHNFIKQLHNNGYPVEGC